MVIALRKARMKNLEAENVGLQRRAVVAEQGEEEAKNKETTLSNVVNKAYQTKALQD